MILSGFRSLHDEAQADWPGPNEGDRLEWERYRATTDGETLPPYDEVPPEVQRIWYGLCRLTVEDIASRIGELAS